MERINRVLLEKVKHMQSLCRFLIRGRDSQQENKPKPVVDNDDECTTEEEALYHSALSFRASGDHERAVCLFRQFMYMYQNNHRTPDSLMMCQALYHLGTSLRYVGNYDESVEVLAKAASARVRSQYLLINCYSSLATSQKYRGNYEQAIILYQKAIALHGREMGHHATSSAGLALLFVSLASTYCEVGEFRLSEDLLDRAFLILECIDPNLEIMGFANYHYGILCREIQNWDQSLLKLSSAKAIYEGLGNLEMSALCKREIAVALSQRNEQQSIRVDGEASELLLDQSLQALQSIGRPTLHLAATHLARGMYYFDRKKFEKAMLDFEESERILIERAPFSVELARTYIAIAESLVVSGDIIGALGRYQQAMTIFERHHSKTPAMIRTAKKIKQLEVESVAERSD